VGVTTDEQFMLEALACAALGRGAVEPNPMVGAVLVRDGAVLARGHHKRFGGAHAEVEAIAAARADGADVRGATMYVTLEPCCHQGKTPPCTRAIIEAGISRVVAAMEDPDSRVCGKGLLALAQAGVEVARGVLEADARELLAPYIKLRTHRRPWVVCKWAQTSDGFLALPPGRGRWITGDSARCHVHQLRGLCDGVCVGIGTVIADDPELTNRSPGGRQPRRLVLDGNLRLPHRSRLVQTAAAHGLIVATTDAALEHHSDKYDWLRNCAGVEVLVLPEHGRQAAGRAARAVDLPALLDALGELEWTHLLVEGGARVHRSFIEEGLADELAVYVAPSRAGLCPDLPRLDIAALAASRPMRLREQMHFGDDAFFGYRLSGG
jgi:diaminohydroxyphosphoribosylaminopyrimidine deaminase/5-amino-6-(5-phosphoribosylamino)uracil reductase